MRKLSIFFFLALLLLPFQTDGDCSCEKDELDGKHSRSISLKLIAIFSILVAGAVGACLPTLGKWLPALRPEKNVFFAIKAFAAGVILATGFIHILPDAFETLTSPCLNPTPWHNFPFAGFFAMVAAIGTLIVDASATGYYTRIHCNKDQKGIAADEESGGIAEGNEQYVQVHTHAANPSASEGEENDIRHKIITQVLELGIVIHSVIIGISLGASNNSSTIKPLVVALTFHQFFEGMGLGGCIVQGNFKIKSMIIMFVFFSLTTPTGIAVGIGISSVYNEKSRTALIVEGILNSGAAGILIYMALVDLLAADFMNSKVQNNVRLHIIINISLLLGAGFMSLLAKWA